MGTSRGLLLCQDPSAHPLAGRRKLLLLQPHTRTRSVSHATLRGTSSTDKRASSGVTLAATPDHFQDVVWDKFGIFWRR
ncbi:hypothetical protein GJAV_G00016880 [Gymnothorax javanicus]|nr:hypothetical protein GJAV_G00016880 [Gymnothorax javanicus]